MLRDQLVQTRLASRQRTHVHASDRRDGRVVAHVHAGSRLLQASLDELLHVIAPVGIVAVFLDGASTENRNQGDYRRL